MQKIKITRGATGVTFETVSIDRSENVFFLNLDPSSAHWPSLASNQLGASPSAPSSECQPDPTGKLNQVVYKCKIKGHESEKGVINIFAVLAAGTTTLAAATKGQPIAQQQVVKGGMSVYKISNPIFQITGPTGAVLQKGSGIGPGLQLIASTNNNGVSVAGTPTVSGTYTFTFEVNDGMGANLQQVQYTMKVT